MDWVPMALDAAGQKMKIGEVEILIEAKNNNGMLEVTVQNPYDETTAMPLKGTGFGLAFIKRRLFLLFGRQDLLQIKKEQEKFIVVVSIPQFDKVWTLIDSNYLN